MDDDLVYVKSDLYPQEDGSVHWVAVVTARDEQVFIVGESADEQEAHETISHAVEEWLDEPVTEEIVIKRLVNDATGHIDNLN